MSAKIRSAAPRQNGRAAPSLGLRILRNIDPRETNPHDVTQSRAAVLHRRDESARPSGARDPARACAADRAALSRFSEPRGRRAVRRGSRPPGRGGDRAGRAPGASPHPAEPDRGSRRRAGGGRGSRVRRARAAPAAEPARAEPEPASRPEAAPAPVGSAQPTSTQPRSVQAKPAEPVRRSGRRAEKALPLGERWKRRLPRVCW